MKDLKFKRQFNKKRISIFLALVMIMTCVFPCAESFASDIYEGLSDPVTTEDQEALNAGTPIVKQVDQPDRNEKYSVSYDMPDTSESGSSMDLMSNYDPYGMFTNGDRYPSLNILQKNGKAFELYHQAGQKLGGYDTMQGGCTDGKYLYYILYNRRVENSKIVKIRIKNMKVVRVSKPLDTEHGNDITYNPLTKRIVILHNSIHKLKITEVSRTFLRVKARHTVKIPSSIPGIAKRTARNIRGFRGIAYNDMTNEYVVFCKGRIVFLILDKNFKPIGAMRPTVKKPNALMYQGMDMNEGYLFLVESSASYRYYNIVAVYDHEGNYIAKLLVRKGWEMENICHYGNRFYAGFYTSYYQTAYKYVTKNGKRKKVAYKQLVRQNYIYKFKLSNPSDPGMG